MKSRDTHNAKDVKEEERLYGWAQREEREEEMIRLYHNLKKMRKISSWSKYIVWNYQIVNKKYCSKNCGQELSREFSRDLVKNV